jgi:urease accessory protein
MKKITRIGIGGPVGSGKTAVIEVITPRLIDMGIKPLIITNDVVTTEDAKQVRRTLNGILIEEKIVGVETGACPHTAVREDPSMNIAAVEELEEKYPDSDVILIEIRWRQPDADLQPGARGFLHLRHRRRRR